MIHVVLSANQHLYARQLEQMFRLRDASRASSETPDVDPQDEDDNVVYLMRLDHWGGVIASLRLNAENDGWRLSRWASPQPADPGQLAHNPQHELMIGAAEFCLHRGASRLSIDLPRNLPASLAAFGWPAGPEVAVTPSLLETLRQTTGIFQPQLIEIDPEKSVRHPSAPR
jgi:N-acyl-L-homoserine lactone synthetase